jgi:ATPase subunit of ABC transporter with duplicated ATPase domains
LVLPKKNWDFTSTKNLSGGQNRLGMASFLLSSPDVCCLMNQITDVEAVEWLENFFSKSYENLRTH